MILHQFCRLSSSSKYVLSHQHKCITHSHADSDENENRILKERCGVSSINRVLRNLAARKETDQLPCSLTSPTDMVYDKLKLLNNQTSPWSRPNPWYPTAGSTSPFPSLHPNSASPSHGSSTCTSLPDIMDKKGRKRFVIFVIN
ncbi:hypothetical protein V9T40_006495 [Parthenolecanium corni]|uniref:Uncharacterized protein n=1 Tax=Parthenolecanium corni TaxID=536013 RepID=A0AAN9TXV0_9HEMI